MKSKSLSKVIISLLLWSAFPVNETLAQNTVSIVSPKASSIIKYGDYPVSLHTGLVDITVPIYTVESGSIKVPIELKYHSSGLKYDETSMEAGLGWDLISGGAIIGSARGLRDGSANFFIKDVAQIVPCNTTVTTSDYESLRQVENGRRNSMQRDNSISILDGETDMYSFNFLQHSGSFCFPPLGSEVDKNGVPGKSAPSGGLFIPANGMKVTDRNLPNVRLELMDTDGVAYLFNRYNVDPNDRYREYYLTRIVSANKADTVSFEYRDLGVLNGMKRPYITSYGTKRTTVGSGSASNTEYNTVGGMNDATTSPPRLEKIRFKGRLVSFIYNEQDNANRWNLQRIEIYKTPTAIANTAIRIVTLSKTKFANNEDRLDEVKFINGSSTETYSYKFEYNGDPGSGVDYWGYANGSTSQYFVPNIINNSNIMTSDREPNEIVMQKGILNKITYPTKGFTQFTYEAHRGRYSLGEPLRVYGGLRIKAVENYSSTGQLAEKKWYTYSEGQTNGYPTAGHFISTSYDYVILKDPFSGAIVNPSTTVTTTTYSSFPNANLSVSGGSQVVYGTVNEYVGNATEDYGYTKYSYSIYTDEPAYSQGSTYRQNTNDMQLRSNIWRSGKLAAKEVYRKVGSAYELVYAINNSYKNINEAEYRNLRAFQFMNFSYDPQGQESSMPAVMRDFCKYPQYHIGMNQTPFDYFNYYTTTGLEVLDSSGEFKDGAWSYTNYNSYNEIGLPTRVSKTSSPGDSLISTYRYPTDFTGTVYANMKSQNILSPVIEEANYKNGNNFLQKTTTNYKLWHSIFYAPDNQQIQYKDGSSKVQTVFVFNKQGNIQELTNNNSEKKAYIWGYNGQYPVAEAINTVSNDIAFTGFEEGDSGGWTWTGLVVKGNSNSYDGENFLGLSSGQSISKAGLTAAKKYRVSVWLWGATAPAGYTAVATKGDWTNYEKIVTGLTTFTLTYAESINGMVDNISICPLDALMTTYTYKPLVGMATKTDTRGLTEYYEYDSFGRLNLIKDFNGHILKDFRYHYKP